MGGILQDAQAVISDGPEDDRRAQDTRLVQHMDIQHLGDPDQQEGQHLPAEAAEPDRGTELPVLDRTHHAGDVVHNHKDQQSIEQAVIPAKKVAEPGTDRGKGGGCRPEARPPWSSRTRAGSAGGCSDL